MIVVSTVPPRTMKDVVVKILEEKSGLRCGVDFWLAYCPERITPGKMLQELSKGDRIVGTFDADSATVAVNLLKTVTSGHLSITDCGSAEVAKLAENTFRDVNIAFANELALICEQARVDVKEVIRLANTHPRVRIHSPGCGVGGPCLVKDPYLLLSAKGDDGKLGIVEASRKLNDSMPSHTIRLLVRALREAGKEVKNSKVAVLGVAYKGETDDATNSPAEQIIRELKKLGAMVVVHDPFSTEEFGAMRSRDLWKAIQGTDCLVAATAHEAFRGLDLKRVKALMTERPVILDGRLVFEAEEARKLGFIIYGIGRAA